MRAYIVYKPSVSERRDIPYLHLTANIETDSVALTMALRNTFGPEFVELIGTQHIVGGNTPSVDYVLWRDDSGLKRTTIYQVYTLAEGQTIKIEKHDPYLS